MISPAPAMFVNVPMDTRVRGVRPTLTSAWAVSKPPVMIMATAQIPMAPSVAPVKKDFKETLVNWTSNS